MNYIFYSYIVKKYPKEMAIIGVLGIIFFIVSFIGIIGWAFFTTSSQSRQCRKVCEVAPDQKVCIESCNKEPNANPKVVTTFNPDTLLGALNKDREGRGSYVWSLEKDDSLCQYAEKLANEYKEQGKNPQDTLEKELFDYSTRDQYFNKFSKVYQQQVETVNFSTHDLPIEFRDFDATTRRARLTHGCFAVIPSNKPNSSIIQFVAGTLRQ